MCPTLADVPATVWPQLSAAERGYLLLTNIGRISSKSLHDAVQRQHLGQSPDLAKVTDGLRKMLPVLEVSSRDGTSFAAMDRRRLTEMRAVLAEIEAVPVQQIAAE